jgi:Zn-dependent peptidase ImmA (M78 family)
MQRGFKSYAEGLAVELRQEMGIPAHGRLCAFELTKFLGIPTIGFSNLIPAAKELGVTAKQLKALEKEVHGLCIPFGPGRAILYNDNNLPARQQSDVAHEASHVLLRHPLADILSGAVTERSKELEDEAAHLGGTLLLPLPAALHLLGKGISLTAAAEEYGISTEMVTYRCNISGARQIHSLRRGPPAQRAA